MVEIGNLTDRALAAIQAAVAEGEPDADHWDRLHRRDLVKEFALTGIPAARALLYSALARAPDSADVEGDAQIVELDSSEGLLHVAARLGRWLKEDSSFWVDDGLLELLDARLGAGTAEAVLESGAASDPMIAQYLQAIREFRKPADPASKSEVVGPGDADKVIEYVRSDPPPNGGRWLVYWGSRATPEARGRVYEALLHEQKQDRALHFLHVFSQAPAPAFDERLWRWLEAQDRRLSRAAVMALRHLSHPRLREEALSRLGRGELSGTLLFRCNYRPGDYETIARLLRPMPDDDQFQGAIDDLLEVVQANPAGEARECLLFAYEHSLSSRSRENSVRLLLALHEAPAWVLEEIRFDASPDVAALCAGHS